MGRSGKSSRRRLSWRYSGRKSWPHSEMQWASSMAKNETALVARERAIEKSGGDAHLFELRDLVLHQGDQWRHNYHGAPPVEDRGQLVAERLATTRGHHYASVASRSDAPDNVLLAWAERFVAPIAAQGLRKRRGAFRRVVLFGHRRPQSCHGSLSGPRSGPSAMQQGQRDGGLQYSPLFRHMSNVISDTRVWVSQSHLLFRV